MSAPAAWYASSVSQGLFGRPEHLWIFFVELDEFDEAFDAEVCQRQETIFTNAIDSYGSVLDLHFIGDVLKPIFVFAEVLGNLGDSGDVMDFVYVGGHAAARAERAEAGVKFQGSSVSSR